MLFLEGAEEALIMGCGADGESRRHAFLRRVLPFSSSSSSLKNSSAGRLFPEIRQGHGEISSTEGML
jgi:hypothetical protein